MNVPEKFEEPVASQPANANRGPVRSLISGILLVIFWSTVFAFARNGLDLGYASMVVLALLLVFLAGIHLLALMLALFAVVRRDIPVPLARGALALNFASMIAALLLVNGL